MSANEKVPDKLSYKSYHLDFEIDTKQWLNSLQPCEISESELCLILSNVTKLDYDNPIEVTDIVNASVICKVERCDGECIECNHMAIRIVFKHPKQVEEIEAVECNDDNMDSFINKYIKELPEKWRSDLDMYLAMKNAMLEALSYPNKYTITRNI